MPSEEADTVVVAGCAAERDGTPGPCLAARVDVAVALWKQQPERLLLLTGGLADGRPAEGPVAAAYAQKLGVPVASLRVEARSTSTDENARFGLSVQPASSVVVVTDAFHQWRAQRCFLAAGVRVSGAPVTPPWDRAIPGALREVLVITYDLATGRCVPP